MEDEINNNHRSQEWPDMPAELRGLGARVRLAYPKVTPDSAFRQALHQRLVAGAQRLQDTPATAGIRATLVKRAAIGVGLAALSVAGGGIALIMLRNRLGTSWLSHGVTTLRTVHGN